MKPVEHAAEMQSLSQCMEKVIANGFTANFSVENGFLHHAESGQFYEAEQVHIVDFYRFEGESNPDDNSILYVIETNDGRKGTLSDAYGMYANVETGEFFQAVEDMVKKKAVKNDPA